MATERELGRWQLHDSLSLAGGTISVLCLVAVIVSQGTFSLMSFLTEPPFAPPFQVDEDELKGMCRASCALSFCSVGIVALRI